MRNLSIMVSVLTITLVLAFSAGTIMAADAMPEDTNVKVLLENDDVRVARASRPPGTVVPMHTHPAYVAYFFEAWDGRLTNSKGKVVEKKFPAGKVIYSPGKTHSVEVIGTTNQEVLVIEWKKK